MVEKENSLRSVYVRQAAVWDHQRSRTLFERRWLDRLLALTEPYDTVLDIGCGGGEPIARYILDQGRRVCGVDFATAMLEIARRRFPDEQWVHADMRELDLGEAFSAIIAWDSFFHLSANDQRLALPRFAKHVAPGGGLLITVGPDEGEAWGQVGGEPVYHASLSKAEYEMILAGCGLRIDDFVPGDPTCGGHSVLLAVAEA